MNAAVCLVFKMQEKEKIYNEKSEFLKQKKNESAIKVEVEYG